MVCPFLWAIFSCLAVNGTSHTAVCFELPGEIDVLGSRASSFHVHQRAPKAVGYSRRLSIRRFGRRGTLVMATPTLLTFLPSFVAQRCELLRPALSIGLFEKPMV